MTPMIEFSTAMLYTFADFLSAEPIIYLFGCILFMFICKGIKSLM